MKERWSNHKSHIKKQFKMCNIATHFKEHANDKHKLAKSTFNNYTNCLKQHFKVMLIEKVEPTANEGNLNNTMTEREAHYQSLFKAMNAYGGLCKRDTRKEIQTASRP